MQSLHRLQGRRCTTVPVQQHSQPSAAHRGVGDVAQRFLGGKGRVRSQDDLHSGALRAASVRAVGTKGERCGWRALPCCCLCNLLPPCGLLSSSSTSMRTGQHADHLIRLSAAALHLREAFQVLPSGGPTMRLNPKNPTNTGRLRTQFLSNDAAAPPGGSSSGRTSGGPTCACGPWWTLPPSPHRRAGSRPRSCNEK